jgi:hypothetical protein
VLRGVKGRAVPALDQEDELSGSRQVVLILRLVLDRRLRLRHGELVDAEATVLGRFLTLEGLLSLVRKWLEQQPADHALAEDMPS